MMLTMLLQASFTRLALVLLLVVSPLTHGLKLNTVADEGKAGWSAPVPLNFETAKPRNTAQTSGSFWGLEGVVTSLPGHYADFMLILFYFRQDCHVLLSLSQLQCWRL